MFAQLPPPAQGGRQAGRAAHKAPAAPGPPPAARPRGPRSGGVCAAGRGTAPPPAAAAGLPAGGHPGAGTLLAGRRPAAPAGPGALPRSRRWQVRRAAATGGEGGREGGGRDPATKSKSRRCLRRGESGGWGGGAGAGRTRAAAGPSPPGRRRRQRRLLAAGVPYLQGWRRRLSRRAPAWSGPLGSATGRGPGRAAGCPCSSRQSRSALRTLLSAAAEARTEGASAQPARAPPAAASEGGRARAGGRARSAPPPARACLSSPARPAERAHSSALPCTRLLCLSLASLFSRPAPRRSSRRVRGALPTLRPRSGGSQRAAGRERRLTRGSASAGPSPRGGSRDTAGPRLRAAAVVAMMMMSRVQPLGEGGGGRAVRCDGVWGKGGVTPHHLPPPFRPSGGLSGRSASARGSRGNLSRRLSSLQRGGGGRGGRAR